MVCLGACTALAHRVLNPRADGPWSSFPLQVGGGATTQNVRVMLSTAAYNTWTIGEAGCPSNWVPDCANSRGFLFNPNQSLTWLPNSIYSTGIEANLGLTMTSNVGYDTVTLGWQGSGGPTVPHSVVFNVYAQQYWLGVFGVNPMPTNFSSLNDPQPAFMQQLFDNGTIPSRSYGYSAGNQYRLNKVFGSLTIGGYDLDRFDQAQSISFGFYTDVARDLLVDIKSIKTDTGSPSDLLPDGQISAFIDSTVPQIWLPESACSAFESAFGLTYNSTANLYLVNGSLHQTLTQSNPKVTFTLTNGKQTVDIVMPYAAFDLNVSQPIVDSSSYYFPLQRAANDTQYTLGRAFLQEAYLIADYDRSNFTVAPCVWDQAKAASTSIVSILSPNLTAIAAQQATPHAPLSAGAIAGIVVGVVVLLLALVALTLLLLRRRRNRRRQMAQQLVDEKAAAAGAADGHGSEPGDSRRELGDAEIRELEAPHVKRAQEMDSPHKVDPSGHGYSEMGGGGDYFGPGKGYSHEVEGDTGIYEMPGSDVHEMPTADAPGHGRPHAQGK